MESASATFDQAATEYNIQLQQGLDLSGESAEYFAEGRVAFLAEQLNHFAAARASILDFGCGVGNAATILKDVLKPREIVGLDCSTESIEVAQHRYPRAPFRWYAEEQDEFEQHFDVAYTSGVFHHIEPEDRQAALSQVHRWLKPGGLFAFFENNPWNPGTRWVMSRIPFDRDAICLSMLEARSRLRQAGFEILKTQSLFYFPNALRSLRPLERWLRYLPMGAQYVVLARRS